MSADRPLVSVCVPVRNGLPYLEDCLVSLFKQNYPNIEFIISLDPSEDASELVVETITRLHLGSSRCVVLKNANPGLFQNLNNSLRAASGDLIQIFSQDDFACADFITSQVAAAHSHEGAALIIANPRAVDDDHVEYVPAESILFRIMHYGSVADNISCVMVPSWIFRKAGFFNEAYRYAGDVEFYYRATRYGDLLYNNTRKMSVRSHLGQASRSNSASLNYPDEELILLHDVWKRALSAEDYRKCLQFRGRIRGSLHFRSAINLILSGNLTDARKVLFRVMRAYGVLNPLIGCVSGASNSVPKLKINDFKKYVSDRASIMPIDDQKSRS